MFKIYIEMHGKNSQENCFAAFPAIAGRGLIGIHAARQVCATQQLFFSLFFSAVAEVC